MTTYGGRYIEDGTPANAGGMGSVRKCTDPQLERSVAIKFLLPGAEKRRILDEVRALQRIRSKHVVRLYDVVIEQPANQIGIVQEWLPGPDLCGLWRTAATPEQYLLVLYQLALGLEDIHAQGLIHRDIKPNNVRYDQEKLLRIFDFGLARSNDDRDALTHGPIGTPPYMAPELHQPGPIRFTQAIDVYAFAMTAVMLTRNTCPAELDERPARSDAWVQSRGFATLHVPSTIAPVLNRALAVDATQRPTMREIRETIYAHLVHDKHRALLTTQAGQVFVCHSGQRSATARNGPARDITIRYDGFIFTVASVQGAVYVNNMPATAGLVLPESCVLTLGSFDQRDRVFVTVDISKPEVVL